VVGLSGAVALSNRVAPLLKAHSTTPLALQNSSDFKVLQQQVSFVIPHLKLLESFTSALVPVSHAQFSRKLQESTQALQKALATTSVPP
jgi:hypothetical protein